MISHDEDGAMGIGIADPIDGMSVGAVLDQLEIAHDDPLDTPVFLGGPVEPSRGFVLHSDDWGGEGAVQRSEEHTSELQSLMRISYAVFCLKKNKYIQIQLTSSIFIYTNTKI